MWRLVYSGLENASFFRFFLLPCIFVYLRRVCPLAGLCTRSTEQSTEHRRQSCALHCALCSTLLCRELRLRGKVWQLSALMRNCVVCQMTNANKYLSGRERAIQRSRVQRLYSTVQYSTVHTVLSTLSTLQIVNNSDVQYCSTFLCVQCVSTRNLLGMCLRCAGEYLRANVNMPRRMLQRSLADYAKVSCSSLVYYIVVYISYTVL